MFYILSREADIRSLQSSRFLRMTVLLFVSVLPKTVSRAMLAEIGAS